MTRDEAHEILGIEPGTSAPNVRRAYMKAVRAHPPERDPDGFQRVRAAYDWLESVASMDADETIEAELVGRVLPDETLPPPETTAPLSLAPEPSWDTYLELMRQKERTAAAKLALALLADSSVAALSPSLLLRHFLLLEGEGEVALAASLFEALTARYETDGTAVTAFELCFELWATVRDYRAIWPWLDPTVRRLIAAHLAVQPWTDAVPSWGWLQEEYPSHFRELGRAHKLVHNQASALEAVLSRRPFSATGTWREKGASFTEGVAAGPGWRIVGWVLFMVANLLIFFGQRPGGERSATMQKMLREAKQEQLRASEQEQLEASGPRTREHRCDLDRTFEELDQVRLRGGCLRWRQLIAEVQSCEKVQTKFDEIAFTAELQALNAELQTRCR